MSKRVSLEPLEKHPKAQFNSLDIKIVANHYGYNYAQIQIKGCGFNGNLTATLSTFCLIDGNGNVIDDINWEDDVELLKKLYDNDKKHKFIKDYMTFEEFLGRFKK